MTKTFTVNYINSKLKPNVKILIIFIKLLMKNEIKINL